MVMVSSPNYVYSPACKPSACSEKEKEIPPEPEIETIPPLNGKVENLESRVGKLGLLFPSNPL